MKKTTFLNRVTGNQIIEEEDKIQNIGHEVIYKTIIPRNIFNENNEMLYDAFIGYEVKQKEQVKQKPIFEIPKL